MGNTTCCSAVSEKKFELKNIFGKGPRTREEIVCVKIQALVRGFLARRTYKEMLITKNHPKSDNIIEIEALPKGILAPKVERILEKYEKSPSSEFSGTTVHSRAAHTEYLPGYYKFNNDGSIYNGDWHYGKRSGNGK